MPTFSMYEAEQILHRGQRFHSAGYEGYVNRDDVERFEALAAAGEAAWSAQPRTRRAWVTFELSGYVDLPDPPPEADPDVWLRDEAIAGVWMNWTDGDDRIEYEPLARTWESTGRVDG